MRKWILMFLLLAMLLGVSRVSFAYDNDVHYCLTYFLARKAGFSVRQARQIASGAVAVDWAPATEPLQVNNTLNPNKLVKSDTLASDVRAKYHSFADSNVYAEIEKGQLASGATPAHAAMVASEAALQSRNARQKALWKQGLRAGNCGIYVHFYQDIYSHGKYWSYAGHPHLGHSPDFLSYDPAGSRQMAQDTYAELANFMHFCLAREPRKAEPGMEALVQRLIAINDYDSPSNQANKFSISEGVGVPDWKLARQEVSQTLGEQVPDWVDYEVSLAGEVSSPEWKIESFKPLSAPLRIKVVDDTTGNPITGANVILKFQNSQNVQRKGLTKDGIFDIASIPGEKGKFQARASKQGYTPSSVLFEVGEEPPYVVAIRLRHGERPVWRLDRNSPKTTVGKSKTTPTGRGWDIKWTISDTTAGVDCQNNAPTTPRRLHATWEVPALPDELSPGEEYNLSLTGNALSDANCLSSMVEFSITESPEVDQLRQAWVGKKDRDENGRYGWNKLQGHDSKTVRWKVPEHLKYGDEMMISARISVDTDCSSGEPGWQETIYTRYYTRQAGSKPMVVAKTKLGEAPRSYGPDAGTASTESRRKMKPEEVGRGTPPAQTEGRGYTITETHAGATVSIDGGDAEELQQGQKLPKGKLLLFKNQGMFNLSIKLPSGATITLSPPGVFRIDAKGELTLLSGGIGVETPPGMPKSSVKINTGDAVVTDQDTVFTVNYDPGTNKTVVNVEKGSVTVTPKTTGKPPVTVKAGQQVTTSAGVPGAVVASRGEGEPTVPTEGAPSGDLKTTTSGTKLCVLESAGGLSRVTLFWPGCFTDWVNDASSQVRIAELIPHTPSNEKFKLEVGDVLTRVNGTPVTGMKQFYELVSAVINTNPPGPLAFELKRGDKVFSASFPPPG